jgi:hypothetical protein
VICRLASSGRTLFALAGTMTLLTVVLAALVSPWFLLLGLVVAANQLLYAAVGTCPASLVLQRVPCATGRHR